MVERRREEAWECPFVVTLDAHGRTSMKISRFAVAAATLLLAPALAHASPFDGAWKLDPAKSHFAGGAFSFTKTAKGYQYSNGSTISYAFALDGKDYPVIESRSVAWSKAADGGFDSVVKANGKVLDKGHWTISPDGATLTGDFTMFRPDGSTQTEHDVSKRLSGGPGLAGRWQDVKVRVQDDTVTFATPAAGRFEIRYPASQEVIAGRLDGSPSPITGPTIPPGATGSYKVIGPRTWTYAITLKDKVYSKGTISVSADGKTLTEKSWVPGKEAEVTLAVYTK